MLHTRFALFAAAGIGFSWVGLAAPAGGNVSAFLTDLSPKYGEKALIRFVAIAMRFLVTAAALFMAAPERANAQGTNVLLLIATHPQVPGLIVIDNAMREALAKNTTQRFQLFSESLDAQRFAFAEFEQEFLALLAKKYKGLQIDVIITVTGAALVFANKHRNTLWPNARVIFHSVSERALQDIPLPERTTGVTERRNIGRTLDLAQRLQPNARRMLVVAGISEYDLDLAEEARPILAARSEMETHYLIGLPQSELIELIAREPASTIVLYLCQFRDREGYPYTPRDLMNAISAVSSAPIYGVFDTYLGHGIAGGIVESYNALGRLLAEQLVLLGTGASLPILSEGPSLCAADTRALRRWSLDERNLPEGCEIRYAELSLWRTYPLQIFGGLALVLFQGALIAGLLLERQRRKRSAELVGEARVETGRYRENLAHLVRVHTVGEMSAALAHEINQPLVAIKNYALAARRRLTGSSTREVGKIEELLDKIGVQASRAGDVLHSLRAMVKKHESQTANVEVGQLVADTLKLVELEGSDDNIRIESTIASDLPPVVIDGIQIQQVVLNLVRNAIEAVREAGVSSSVIEVGVVGTAKHEITVSVADHGPGIAPSEVEHIFDPFYSTKGGGLGIGLSISRAIVEAHGGRLSFTPNVGGGCVFRFTLPILNKGS